MLTLGKTCSCTGGICCRICNLGMTESRNSLLCYNNCTAYRTMLTLGKTCSCTGCRYRRICNLGMTESRNSLLSYSNCTAYRTMLTLGKTCSCTGCRYCRICNLGMTECGNSGLLCKYYLTYGAVLLGISTCFCTGRSLCTLAHNVMSTSYPLTVRIFIHILLASSSSSTSVSVIKNCGSHCDLDLIIAAIHMCRLIGLGLCAGSCPDTGTLMTDNISTGAGGINSRIETVYLTVDLDLCINKIGRGSGIGSAGSIGMRGELGVHSRAEGTPCSIIISNNSDTGGEICYCILTDNKLGAGK